MPSLIWRLFLHFFDVHFLEMKAAAQQAQRVRAETRMATRLSVLAADEVLIPAASYFESSLCRQVLDELGPLFPLGILRLVGGGASLVEFIEKKWYQYDSGSPHHRRYFREERIPSLPFRTRARSATSDIARSWLRRLEESSLSDIFPGSTSSLPPDIEERWSLVPSLLAEKAFILPNVLPILTTEAKISLSTRNRLHYVINRAYFESFLSEFNAGIVVDLVYLESPHEIVSAGNDLSYIRLLTELRRRNLLGAVSSATPEELIEIGRGGAFIEALSTAMAPPQAERPRARAHISTPGGRTQMNLNSLRSFIVHGHDDSLLLQLKDYIQNRLEWPEPIVLAQRPNRGRTIIEKFEEESGEIDVVFVLLTPDDLGGKTEDVLETRARLNVLFELGYFVGQLGRRSARVILLHAGDIEIPSDLHGVTYIKIDRRIEDAGESIRREVRLLKRR